MKKIKLGLLARIILAIALGIGAGFAGTSGTHFCDIQRAFQPVSELHHSSDYCRTGHPGHRRHRKRSRENAGSHRVAGLRSHPVFRISFIRRGRDLLPQPHHPKHTFVGNQ